MSKDKSVSVVVPRDRCCGCQNCNIVCPTKAISFEVEDGFKYPIVDDEKCVNCGLCTNNCPVANNTIDPNEPLRGYAAWNNNQKIRINSTSGGIYYALGKKMLDEGGYICACSFTDDYRSAIHIIGNDIDTLNRTLRSKYFQSDINGVYSIIKEKLDREEKVLFVGTPCQCKALQLFLHKEYINLIICDFVCRGVNSPKAYQCFINTLERKYRSKAISVHFKNKGNGWNALSTRVDFENGQSYVADKYTDPWVNGYIRGHLYMRECCYECPYTTTARYSDISIGDFWGHKERNPELEFTGISCILINTQKGQTVFESLNEYGITSETVPISDIVQGNGCLNGATLQMPISRKEFFSRCDTEDFDKLVFSLIGLDSKAKYKNFLRKYYYKLQNFIKYPNGYKLRKKILESEVLIHGDNQWN